MAVIPENRISTCSRNSSTSTDSRVSILVIYTPDRNVFSTCSQHVQNFKSTKSDAVSFAQTVNACSTSQNSPSQLHTASTICISYLTKPGAFANQTNKGLNNHKHINLTQKAARCLPLLTQMQVFNCLHLTSRILK